MRKKGFLAKKKKKKKNSLGSVDCQIAFPPILRFFESRSFGLSKYSF